jgi:methyl-accepting chemotaxis protein
VTDIIADISAASQEQSAGIEQVNQAITQMDETTQQNAALVEEATAAARSMEQQAGQLVQTVAVFRVQDGQPARSARAEPAATPASVVVLPKRAAAAPRGKTATRARAKASPAVTAEAGEWQEF